MVINKVNEEAQCFHHENRNGTPNPAAEIPLTETKWDLNSRDRPPGTLRKVHIGRT